MTSAIVRCACGWLTAHRFHEFTVLPRSFSQTKFIARRPVHARRAPKVELIQVSRTTGA